MNILPFLDLDSGPFFFRAIQIIAADKIQQGQFPRISSHQDIKKNKNLNRLDTILHWKYSMSDMLILIVFTKPKIEAVVQTHILKSYKIYY